MLKDLFSNRLFISVLGLFIFCVVGSLLYMQHVEKQRKQEVAEAHERINQWNASRATSSPPTDTAQGGHLHDGAGHAEPHADTSVSQRSEAEKKPDAEDIDSKRGVLTEEQRTGYLKYLEELGLEPPPKGYNYEWDAEGNVSLYEYNVPTFETTWSEESEPGRDFYKLTDDEWRRYRALGHIISQTPLRIEGEDLKRLARGEPTPKVNYAPGVVELAEEWRDELWQKTAGPSPSVSTSVTWNREPTEKELKDIARREYELLKAMEKPERPSPGPWDENFIDALVKELGAEVQSR